MTKYIHIISVAIALLCLSSCQHDEDGPVVTKERFRIKAYVGDSGFTRIVSRPDDGFSVAGFSDGDVGGFYSESGDRNNGNLGFENSPMTFSGGYFVGENDMSVDINRLGKTFIYYPYSAGTNGRQIVRDPVTGEVNDILLSNTMGNPENTETALVARFAHLFSMLVIEGGYGFENFHLEDVSVTLSEPVETVEFLLADNEDGYRVVLNGEHMDNGTKPEESFATVVGHYNEEKGKYYIIIPTDGNIAVKSINASDDSGRKHTIRVGAKVEKGVRYSLTLEMDELTPTIYLHDITLWDSGIDLSANEERGINDAGDLKDWILLYNQADPSEDELMKYGDKVQVTDAQGNPTGEEYWRFYLTADIDMSSFDTASAAHLVNTLKDEFDGCGYTITGLSFTGKTNAALFNLIDGAHACVKNLTVDNLVVDTTGPDAVGALVTEFRTGTVTGCSFTNLSMHAQSAVGALAGTITGGNQAIVQNCKFSGAIFGTSTVSKVAGSGTVSDDIRKGCDTSNVMFGEI